MKWGPAASLGEIISGQEILDKCVALMYIKTDVNKVKKDTFFY